MQGGVEGLAENEEGGRRVLTRGKPSGDPQKSILSILLLPVQDGCRLLTHISGLTVEKKGLRLNKVR